MAQVSELRGRGLLITRIGAKTGFTEVRVYWASSQSDSGKGCDEQYFPVLAGNIHLLCYFRSSLLDITKDTIEERKKQL
jgi:hypothetical protein